MRKLLKQLLQLKKQQIEALEAQDWAKLTELESDFQAQTSLFHIDPQDITEEVVEDLHEINKLNLHLLENTKRTRNQTMHDLLEIKKGKLMVKAYTGKS